MKSALINTESRDSSSGKNRNRSVDAIRGIAMLMVVLGHTIAISTSGYEPTFAFQVIWTLQMPLFMMISGYVTRYSRPISSAGSLKRFISKRSLAYMLPWAVWTFLVRGIIIGQHNYLDVRYVLWHMDSGYWFLASIWILCMAFGIVDYICNKIPCCIKHPVTSVIYHLIGCFVAMAALAIIGLKLGFDFFCIKLSLYYFPFYLCGYIFGQFQNDLSSAKWYPFIQNVIVAICFGAWIYLITRIDFYSAVDSSKMIILRFIASLIGCVAFIGLLSRFNARWAVTSGVYSIQIYLLHYLFLNILRPTPQPMFVSVTGIGLVVLNYTLTLAAVALVIYLINNNSLLNKILFYKSTDERKKVLG